MTRRLAGTVIFGLGVTGHSCLRHLRRHGPGRMLTVVDTRRLPPHLESARAEFPDVEFICGGLDAAMLASADEIVVSPGVPLDSCLLAEARRAGVPFTSDIALFLEAARAPVIAITGTNGKSTVTALVGHLLAAAGLDVGVGGNLGEAALDLLDEGRDGYVLELSSFQLERLARVGVDAGCILNVTPDHLDRYPDVAAYAASKQRIYDGCRVALYNRHDPATYPPAGPAAAVSFGLDAPAAGDWGIVEADGIRHYSRGRERFAPVHATRLRGRHNELNVLAALALTATRVPVDGRVVAALSSFEGLPHRCVAVATVDGVTYVDDSKATNLGACVAALEGLGDAARRHIVLIAGGDAKGIDLSPLGLLVGRYVRLVVTLGRDAPRVEAAVGGAAPITRATTMDEAVQAARAAALPGDIVLLSPACSSLDMFRNFEARGDAFADAARRLSR
jgi:UDP-N-acetylmuramoylalanine--D-glutamate ligase